VTRGDVFALPEDDYLDYNLTVDFGTDEVPVADPTELPTPPVQVDTTPETKPNPEETLTELPKPNPDESEEPEELCSGKPFDAFTDLKNGSLYAFRGKYFYELDRTTVRPGYPKLISDVWGIEGPIDAAFTRINCQGKTYLFKGTQYWRFDDGALDPGYPRDISEGFEGIPDNVDAAFALPAHSYHGNERVYFFKEQVPGALCRAVGSAHPTRCCPSHSPSAPFPAGANGPWYISRDWRGVPSRLDAAMAGRLYVASHQPRRRKSRRQRKRYNHHRSLNLGFWSWLQHDPDSAGVESDGLSGSTCEMLQSVYFFVGDKYYRVNLRSKRVDLVRPRYPRSIAQYWLDCPQPTEST
ncbi:VTNC protein, partial [Leiothrix lutea]|nr:VTNC protein [Leiothrix lutea]